MKRHPGTEGLQVGWQRGGIAALKNLSEHTLRISDEVLVANEQAPIPWMTEKHEHRQHIRQP